MWGDQDEAVAGAEIQYRDIQPGGSCDLILAQQRQSSMLYWEMNSARWPGSIRRMITLWPGSYEVAINLVGDNFHMPAYRYCVCLTDDGQISVEEPPSLLSTFASRLKGG
jgi:hypothetical protein